MAMNATASPNPNGSTPATRIIADTLLYQLASCAAAADPTTLFTADYNSLNGQVGDITPSRAVVQIKGMHRLVMCPPLPLHLPFVSGPTRTVTHRRDVPSSSSLLLLQLPPSSIILLAHQPSVEATHLRRPFLLVSSIPKQHNRRREHLTGLQCLDWSQRPRF